MACAVDEGRFRKLLRNAPEEAVQDEDLIGHAEGDVGQDDAGIGVDQPKGIDEREERRQHHLEGDHGAEDDEEQQCL